MVGYQCSKSIEIKRRNLFMKVKQAISKVTELVAIKIATRDANVACSYLTYQPKLPKAVKRLKK